MAVPVYVKLTTTSADEVLSKVAVRVAELVGSEILVALELRVTLTWFEILNQLSFPSTTSSSSSLSESYAVIAYSVAISPSVKVYVVTFPKSTVVI